MQLAIVILVSLIFAICVFSVIGFNVIFLIVAIIAVAALIMRNKSIHENINTVPENSLHIVNVEKGGVFELRGVGDMQENMTLTVLAKHLYQEGDFSWFELECDKGEGNKVWVEVEDDDETQVSVMLKKMKLSDIGVKPYELDKIDDDESGSIYGGYKYVDSGDAVFYRFCDSEKAAKLYYYDFVKGNKLLGIEKWGTEYEVSLSQIMRPAQVVVLRNNANG